MLSWLNSDVGLGLLRNLLLAAGSGLVTQGVIGQSGLNDVVGALIIVIGVIFSAISNRTKSEAKAVVQAVNDHPSLTVIPADQTFTGKPVVSIAPAALEMGIPMSNLAGPNPYVHLQ